MLRFASYNIRRGVGTDRRKDVSRNLAVLREIDAAVVAVQETDSEIASLARRGDVQPPAYDAVLLGPSQYTWRGNMVLVREDVTVYQATCVPLPALEEPRGAIVLELSAGGVDFRVVAMHLGLVGLWRYWQADTVLAHLSALERQKSLVMMGDLNEWNTRWGCLGRFQARHHVVAPGPSFHSRWPLLPLDRIITSPEVAVIGAGVHHSELARLASDHLPVWADVELPAPAPKDALTPQNPVRAEQSGQR